MNSLTILIMGMRRGTTHPRTEPSTFGVAAVAIIVAITGATGAAAIGVTVVIGMVEDTAGGIGMVAGMVEDTAADTVEGVGTNRGGDGYLWAAVTESRETTSATA
jgi:hypothetical protein